MKYKVGTRLKHLTNHSEYFRKNEVIVVKKSVRYPGTYAFEGFSDDGYHYEHIENPNEFKVIHKLKITNWKNELED